MNSYRFTMDALDATAGLLVILWGWVAAQAWRTDRALIRLAEVRPERDLPPLSVVVPCRNEARDVEAAVGSLLSQDLPALEVLAVDDRSEDGTGAILDRLAGTDPRLRVIHLAALPAGWLGKTHALDTGGRLARGEWILFTDGDVVFGPGALARALSLARAHDLGHLVAAPRFVAPGYLERAFVSAFAALASLAFRVADLRRPGTSAYAGVGAFNLVRRSDWLRVGGHRRLAAEVIDDVKLGLILRRSGVPQGVVSAGPLVSVRWQRGFRASVLGLMKNAFAACEYRPALAALAALTLAGLGAGPAVLAIAAATTGRPLALGLALTALLGTALVHGGVARRLSGGSGLEALAFPLAALSLAGVLLASALSASVRRGVRWRGTFYPLAALRRGLVRQADWPASAAVGWPEAGAAGPGRERRGGAPGP